MPNLMDAVSSKDSLTGSRKSVRTCLTEAELNISASKSNRFYLVRFPVRKLPLLSVESSSDSGAIVVDVNYRRKKSTDSGFIPKVVVLKGLKSLYAAKSTDKNFCNVWVGEKALKRLNISAEDSIGSSALQAKLNRLINEKYKNQNSSKATNGSYSACPWIEEIFPYDNYFVFRYEGETFKQIFAVNPTTQEVTLVGEAARAVLKYAAREVSAASLADMLYKDTYIDTTMNQEVTLDHMNSDSRALGGLSSNPKIVPDATWYPPGSELARPELRSMLNVREALEIFLNVLKDGMKGPLARSFAPVRLPEDKFWLNASREAEIAAREAHRKINIPDFLNWQSAVLSSTKTQTKYGLTASAYAYVGDKYDISTWFLKANTPEAIKKSLKLVMHCDGIPDRKKLAIQGKLAAMYKKITGKG